MGREWEHSSLLEKNVPIDLGSNLKSDKLKKVKEHGVLHNDLNGFFNVKKSTHLVPLSKEGLLKRCLRK